MRFAAGLADLDAADLAGELYARWYAGWTEPDGPARAAPGGSRDLTEALRAAHAGSRVFDADWRARSVSSAGRVLAERAGETRLLATLDYVALDRPGLPPRVGGAVAAPRRRDSLEASAGFWLAAGDGWSGDAPGGIVRVYWNVAADDAPALVTTLTAALRAGPDAWSLKLPADAADHVRCDVTVLYLPRPDFDAHAPALAAAAATLRDVLLPREPPLSLRLAPGVGLAEDPASGEQSFGTSRCTLIAEGVVEGLRAGAHDDDELLAAVLDRLRAAGIDPERPHLEPGSDRRYAWPTTAALFPPRPQATAVTAIGLRRSEAPLEPAERFLAAARGIADGLVHAAIWHEDRCTWLGDAIEPNGERWVVVTRTCDGHLYGGTAGVAHFLARVAAITGDGEAARTARGALAHALAAARREPRQGGG
ncbi:MAG TPA: T3SS effector HopA1 family protein, partial [Solirubrobacteraceae bacterium]|nr:T3SS effector HopA1 family protein [Solirubrobacteraceae bacterium]